MILYKGAVTGVIIDEMVEWASAASWSALPNDAVHVWRVRLDALDGSTVSGLVAALSPDELERAARYRRPLDQERFRRTRGVLRLLLEQYTGVTPRAVRLAANIHGKPRLTGGTLQFNVSHSDDLALFAFSQARAVGVDVEQRRDGDEWRSIAAHFFSSREQGVLSTLSGETLTRVFFTIWTRKEAYVKARGLGLSLPLDSFDVGHDAGSRPIEVRAREEHAAGLWTVSDLDAGPHFAALCVEGDDAWRLRLWDW